jgi:hypothetical protein
MIGEPAIPVTQPAERARAKERNLAYLREHGVEC